MANSVLTNRLFHKTIDLFEKKDPVKNLWRNVLILALEDFLKNKEKQAMRGVKSFSKEEIWFYSEDFKLVCEFAQLEPNVVKEKTFKAVERMRKKYDEKNMSEMSGKWFYKTNGINRQTNRSSTTMYPV